MVLDQNFYILNTRIKLSCLKYLGITLNMYLIYLNLVIPRTNSIREFFSDIDRERCQLYPTLYPFVVVYNWLLPLGHNILVLRQHYKKNHWSLSRQLFWLDPISYPDLTSRKLMMLAVLWNLIIPLLIRLSSCFSFFSVNNLIN